MKLPLSRVAELVGASGEFDHQAVARGYSIDSRTIQAGELFFAVKGERMDGHDFVAQALGERRRGRGGAPRPAGVLFGHRQVCWPWTTL